MQSFSTLFKTELKLSFRDMNMVIFAICMPVIVMVILGAIYGDKPAFPGAEYTFLAQSFGAGAAIAICAAGLMGLPLVVSDYRYKKILKRYQVTPTSPVLLLGVQVAVNALYAVVSMILVYLTVRLFGGRLPGTWIGFLGAFLLVMLSIFSIGMMVGGLAPNMKAAGLWCMILYFPMLIFSGTTLPYEIMPRAMQRATDILPLTQGIKLMKAAALGLPAGSVWLPIVVMAVLTAVCIGISIRFFRWE